MKTENGQSSESTGYKMYCLDTNILIDYIRGKVSTIKKINQFIELGIELSTTSICVCELYKGAYLSKDSEKNINIIWSILFGIKTLSFIEDSYGIFGKYFSDMKKFGKMANETDLMIASIAISHDKIFVTSNDSHYKNIPGIKLRTWK